MKTQAAAKLSICIIISTYIIILLDPLQAIKLLNSSVAIEKS